MGLSIVNSLAKEGAQEIGALESNEEMARQVGDFYDWSRDYWIDLGRDATGAGSGMLNFGLWDETTHNMFEAQESLQRAIAQCLGELPKAAKGLEIGCGIGGAAIRLVRQRDVRLTCMDIVSTQIEIGRSNALTAGVGDLIAFQQGNSMDMPFQDSAFDFSYCIESSFHYPDKLAFFRENFRVLRLGAVSIVADITCADNSQVAFTKGNYFRSVEETRQLMRDAGFTVVDVVHIGGRVFHALRAYVEKYNTGRREKLCRYWNLVLKNYVELFEQGLMGYEIFVLRKEVG